MEDERLSGVVLHISDSQTSYPGEHQIRVTLRIGTFIPGHPFVTSPMIRRAIQKIKLAGGRPIGRMEFFIDHQKKIITSHEIRPTSLLHGKANSSFQKIGLSTRVELAIEKIFKRQFPDYSLRSTANPSAVRTTQLQKRGRTIGKPTPITIAHAMTRKAAIKQFREHLDDVKRVREREKRRLRLVATIRRRVI